MSRCVTCRTSRRELCHDRTGDLLCLRCYLPRYPNEVLTDEEIAKGLPIERPPTKRGQRVRPESLERAAAALADRGLRPVIDHRAELVRADCPKCMGGESDPLGLYRPLQVLPRDSGPVTRCDILHHRSGCDADGVPEQGPQRSGRSVDLQGNRTTSRRDSRRTAPPATPPTLDTQFWSRMGRVYYI